MTQKIGFFDPLFSKKIIAFLLKKFIVIEDNLALSRMSTNVTV
jgi:hypothetical protein